MMAAVRSSAVPHRDCGWTKRRRVRPKFKSSRISASEGSSSAALSLASLSRPSCTASAIPFRRSQLSGRSLALTPCVVQQDPAHQGHGVREGQRIQEDGTLGDGVEE